MTNKHKVHTVVRHETWKFVCMLLLSLVCVISGSLSSNDSGVQIDSEHALGHSAGDGKPIKSVQTMSKFDILQSENEELAEFQNAETFVLEALSSADASLKGKIFNHYFMIQQLVVRAERILEELRLDRSLSIRAPVVGEFSAILSKLGLRQDLNERVDKVKRLIG